MVNKSEAEFGLYLGDGMEKLIKTGFTVAASIYVAQAVYALFFLENKEIYLSYLQTGLLFIALGYLERLRPGRRLQSQKHVEQ